MTRKSNVQLVKRPKASSCIGRLDNIVLNDIKDFQRDIQDQFIEKFGRTPTLADASWNWYILKVLKPR